MSLKNGKSASEVLAISCVGKDDYTFDNWLSRIELPKTILEIRKMMTERFGASLLFESEHGETIQIPANGYVFLCKDGLVDHILSTDELDKPKRSFKDISDATIKEIVELLKSMLEKTDNADRQAEINNILTVLVSGQEFRANGEPSIDKDFDKFHQRILELVRSPDSAGRHDEIARGGKTVAEVSLADSQD